jgi:hypothetical protein
MKACTRCHKVKPPDYFQRNASTPSGRRSICKQCEKERRGVIGKPDNSGAPVVEPGLDESRLDDLELGPAGIAPIAPVTPEEAHRAAPEGYHVKGVSTLYDGAGGIKQQWVKTDQDLVDRIRAFEKAIDRICGRTDGRAEPVSAPEFVEDDLLCLVPFGDPHIGLYAWAAESGDDFDLEIAECNMVNAVDHLITLAPPAATLVLLNLGDFYHGDSSTNQTPQSGHPLDIDTRWEKVIDVGISIKERCINRGLEKFRNVIDVNVEGNHDPTSSIMLRRVMRATYRNEPRVTVDTTPGKFYWHRFGASLIGSTHGDSAKLADLPGIMACDRARDWGETKYRHWYTGHVHHDSSREAHGVIVETFRTLAPKDAWHASKGYRSGQDLKLDVFHRRWGRINRHTVGIEQIRHRLAEDEAA